MRDEKWNTDARKRESGLPGEGAGRRDEVGGSGVYPASAGNAPADAVIRSQAEWGQGDRGAAGYEESGRSELAFDQEELRAAREGRPLRQQGGTAERPARGDGDLNG